MVTEHYDIAIVGAGILGLAHAYHLHRAGRRVIVLERGHRATGASVRNFGMVWPIGQPPGEMREMALRSREIWLEALAAAQIWHERCGSLHLAYAEDELGVLEEFVGLAPAHGYDCSLIGPGEVANHSPVVRQQGLRGAMYSPSELVVFPRQVVFELARYLESVGVDFRFASPVTHVEGDMLWTRGRKIRADHILLCTGDDFETLFPDRFDDLGMTRSKLQMMRMRPKRADYRIGTHLCAGLTQAHYANFGVCSRLDAVKERFRNEMPEYIEWGIHLLVSQHEDGGLTVGDSHVYGLDVDPFRQELLDNLILDYLDTFLDVTELEVIERWYGVYAKHPTRTTIVEKLNAHTTAVTGVGGAGMTLSFGLAERVCKGL